MYNLVVLNEIKTTKEKILTILLTKICIIKYKMKEYNILKY